MAKSPSGDVDFASAYVADGNRVAETAARSDDQLPDRHAESDGYAQVLDELVSGAVTKTYTYGRRRISENSAALGRRAFTATMGTAMCAS